MALQNPVAVYNAANNLEAQQICNLLNASGVEAFVTADESIAGLWSFGFLPEIHKPQVWIDRSAIDRAKPLLEEYERRLLERQEVNLKTTVAGEATVEAACDECGRRSSFPVAQEGTVQDCPHCGAYVDVGDPAESKAWSGAAEGGDDRQDAPVPASDHLPDRAGVGSPECQLLESPRAASETRRLWVEVFAVLWLGVIPYLWSAVSIFSAGPVPITTWHPSTWHFVDKELWYIITSLQISLPVLVILALNKEPWSKFGIVRPAWGADLSIAFMVFWVARLAGHIARSGVPQGAMDMSYHNYIHATKSTGLAIGLLVLLACVTIGFSEELVMRGYLLPRLERLLGSTWRAIIVSSLLFGSYHIYQGLSNAAGAVAVGLTYACAFCLTRRLWPLCIAHAATNFLAWGLA